jgi:hypothetical protein
MDIKKTLEVLNILLDQKEWEKGWETEEKMIRYTEEIEAIKQAIRNTQRQKDYEDWTNKNF